MRYNSLKASIPASWRHFFMNTSKDTYFPLPPHNYDMVTQSEQANLSRVIYKYISDDILVTHNKFLKWRNELGDDFCEGICDFGTLHMDIYRLTNVAKYRSFQYRLLQRGIVTNIQLYKWKITESTRCFFCKEGIETITHLLSECTIVQELWQNVKKFLEQYYGIINVDLNTAAIIKNQICMPKGNIGNMICLITKQYVYQQKCLQGSIHFPCLKEVILKTQNMEKYIAIKNNRLSKHLKKWHGVPSIATNEGEAY